MLLANTTPLPDSSSLPWMLMGFILFSCREIMSNWSCKCCWIDCSAYRRLLSDRETQIAASHTAGFCERQMDQGTVCKWINTMVMDISLLAGTCVCVCPCLCDCLYYLWPCAAARLYEFMSPSGAEEMPFRHTVPIMGSAPLSKSKLTSSKLPNQDETDEYSVNTPK